MMHELPVTESILEIALRHAASAGAKRIKILYLVLGDLSSILDESVQFYWDIISKNTIAEGARLSFRRVPTELECQDCHRCYTPSRDNLACPNCQGIRIKVIHGEELMVEAIDIE